MLSLKIRMYESRIDILTKKWTRVYAMVRWRVTCIY